MKQETSQYVDKLAVEKILVEKLSKVSHSPHLSFFQFLENPLEDFFQIQQKAFLLEPKESSDKKQKILDSSIQGPYPENNQSFLVCYPAINPCGNVLLVHGLFEENRMLYRMLVNALNRFQISLYIMILPYHYERKPAQSLFSGEYFLSADIARTQWAFRQAIWDLFAWKTYLEKQALPLLLAGFSTGGCILLNLAMLIPLQSFFLINPISNLSNLLWNNELISTIKKDIIQNGWDLQDVMKTMRALDPVSNPMRKFMQKKLYLALGEYDQIVDKHDYEKFIEEFQPSSTFLYPYGHLNILRFPKLAEDIKNTLFGLVKGIECE